ncbi:MAG: hypothetical protein GY860_22270 [Desulfobacteraceae bacterium]|nr:hypothetical protein [Desulfobacteraceae bacterium]
MKLNSKLAICLVAALVICSGTSLLSNRMVVKKKIQEITKSKLEDIVTSVLSFVEKQEISQKNLETIINKEIGIGKSGFLAIIDTKGNMVIHRKVQGKNWIAKPFIKHIVEKKNGYHRYISPKTNTYKVAAFRYFEPLDWIILATTFESDDLKSPIKDMTMTSMMILVPLVIILFGIFYLIINRVVTKPLTMVIDGLSEGANQVASASGQISNASQSLAEGSSQQAASIEETSSSMEDLSSMTKKNAGNSSHADSLMAETNQVISSANGSMIHLTNSMEEISKASEKTSKIITTIDEIAFQTNLLALNAAVEAARAGEAGAGFSVVADEVRNLAMRAANAAKNTAELIESIVKKVDGGSELVSTTSDDFSKVANSADKVGGLVAQISEASNEQSRGIDQINTAVFEIDKIVQQNAANAEESAAASEEMNAQAEQFKKFVGDLVLLVTGKKAKI